MQHPQIVSLALARTDFIQLAFTINFWLCWVPKVRYIRYLYGQLTFWNQIYNLSGELIPFRESRYCCALNFCCHSYECLVRFCQKVCFTALSCFYFHSTNLALKSLNWAKFGVSLRYDNHHHRQRSETTNWAEASFKWSLRGWLHARCLWEEIGPDWQNFDGGRSSMIPTDLGGELDKRLGFCGGLLA